MTDFLEQVGLREITWSVGDYLKDGDSNPTVMTITWNYNSYTSLS